MEREANIADLAVFVDLLREIVSIVVIMMHTFTCALSIILLNDYIYTYLHTIHYCELCFEVCNTLMKNFSVLGTTFN